MEQGDVEQAPCAPASDGRVDDTCVVVPLYNEAQTVEGVVRELLASFTRVVCVDDGSRDGCGDLARRAGAVVITHAINRGAGAATQTGIHYALRDPRNQFIVTFDADGQHRTVDALAMREDALHSGSDVVLGTRAENSEHIPRLRRMVLAAGLRFTNWHTGLSLTDTHIGLRLFTRSAASQLDLRHSGMAHGSEILSQVARLGLTLREVPVWVEYTDYSRGKGQSNLNALNIVVDLAVRRLYALRS